MGDPYTEEFQQYMHLARRLAKNLHERDLYIYRKWIRKISSLDSDDLTVKKNRNFFFKYMLHVLQDGRLEGPFSKLQIETEKKDLGTNRTNVAPPTLPPIREEEETKDSLPPLMCYWSPDTTTYVGVQPLKGNGALIYMAVSYNPQLGWDIL